MYYEEQIINGVLCHRNHPTGDWIPFTAEELTKQLSVVKSKLIAIMTKELDQL